MLYLGQVQRQRGRDSKLQILAIRGNNGLWMLFRETLNLSNQHQLENGVLVLVELNSKRQISNLEPAAGEIIRYLSEAYEKIAAIENQKAEFAEWRYALEYQSIELQKRDAAITNREALLAAKEQKVEEILKQWRKQQEKN